MPAISVIVPVYNVEKYIHRCVDSILAQTFTDFELILVDDGSPDNCGKICDEYAEKDSRVRVIHQENGGLSAARNAGIDWALTNSDSEWISFIDSDDWVHEEYLERLFSACVDTNVKISSVGFAETDGSVPVTYSNDDFLLKTIPTEEFYFQPVCYCQLPTISAWGKLYCKELWKEIRFPVGKIHEDRFTTHLLLFQTKQVTYLTAPLYFYFQRAESITNSEWTPKRLDDLEAVKGQIEYFEEKDLIRIKKYFIKNYFILMKKFYAQSVSYPDIHTKLKCELFETLKRYRGNLSQDDIENAYTCLCPKLNLYYVFRRYIAENGLWYAVKKTVKYIGKKAR